MIRKRNVAPGTAPVESHCPDVLCAPLTPSSLHPTVACLHSGVDPQGQRQAAQPGHGLQRHPDHPERAARGRRRLRLHGLQHVCHGRGQCHPLRARFVIHGAPVTSPCPSSPPLPHPLVPPPPPTTHQQYRLWLWLFFFFFVLRFPPPASLRVMHASLCGGVVSSCTASGAQLIGAANTPDACVCLSLLFRNQGVSRLVLLSYCQSSFSYYPL